MKKTLIMFSALLALLCGLMFTGCNLFDNLAPKDTWCKKTITYNEYQVPCYFYYSDKGYTNSNLKDSVKIDAGLTIVIVPPADTIFGTGNLVGIKTISKDESFELNDEGGSTKSIKADLITWGALYNTALTKVENNEMPPCLHKDTNYKVVENINAITEKFNLKDFLKELVWEYL